MEGNLGRASVDIDLLLAPLRRDLDRARGMVQTTMDQAGTSAGRSMSSRIAGGIGSGLKSVAKATAYVAAAGVVALGSLGIAGAKAGIQTASAMEQADIAFTTMLGSGKKADAFLAELGDFAAKTPFEFPELQTAASSLISAGINAKKVIPIMTSLGNATSGMGTGSEGIKRATVALQQMNAAGRITAEDLNQLRDAGIPVYDLLAAATGKSKAKVTELASEGKLGRKELEQLMAALADGKGLERFNGLMEKQSASLQGMFSTLKDTVGMGLANAVKPWLPAMKDALGGLQAQAGPFFAWLAAKSADAAAHAPEWIARIKAGVSQAGAVLDKAQDKIAAVMESIRGADAGDTGASFDRLRDSVMELGPALAKLDDHLPSIADAMNVTAVVVGFLADHTDELAKLMPVLAIGFLAVKAGQLAANIALAASLPMKLVEIKVNRQLVASNRALVASRASLTGATVQGTAAETTGTLAKIRGRAATIAKAAAEKAAAAAMKIVTAAQWLLNAALTANPIGLVIAALVALGLGFVLLWKKSETFRSIVTGVWDALKVATGNAVAFIVRILRGWLSAWLTVAGGILRAAAGAFGWIPGLGGKLKGAVRAFDGMKDGILGKLDEVADAADGLGENVAKGMAAGISREKWRVIEATTKMTSQAIRNAKRDLGVASPSRVFAEIGHFTGQGLALGMDRSLKLVEASASRMASATLPGGRQLRLATPTAAGLSGLASSAAMGALARTAAPAAGGERGGPFRDLVVHTGQKRVEEVLPQVVRGIAWELDL